MYTMFYMNCAYVQAALAEHLKDISMGEREYKIYCDYKARVENHITTLRNLFEEMMRRSKERVWLRHQQIGELDDTKLIDGLTGDKMIFKRRGVPDNAPHMNNDNDAHSGDKIKKR